MTTVCYCNDCVHARSDKKRLPFTSGDNIFITGCINTPPVATYPHELVATPNRSFADDQSDRSATQSLSHSLSDNFISRQMLCNRRSLSPRGPSPLKRAGSVRGRGRSVGSLSNVSLFGDVRICEGDRLRQPPSYHCPHSYSSFIVIMLLLDDNRSLIVHCLCVHFLVCLFTFYEQMF